MIERVIVAFRTFQLTNSHLELWTLTSRKIFSVKLSISGFKCLHGEILVTWSLPHVRFYLFQIFQSYLGKTVYQGNFLQRKTTRVPWITSAIDSNLFRRELTFRGPRKFYEGLSVLAFSWSQYGFLGSPLQLSTTNFIKIKWRYLSDKK